ncbi:MAG: SpoIVB peptidase S55 domain-containing protein [Armatimonadota bacterium]|nr:SpoIVB peptidase S55 domain-containing protein [Armatimonadota bacterium]
MTVLPRLAGLVLLAMAAPGVSVAASFDWLPLQAVQPGMRGVARTVVRGTTVEAFDVEALAVVPGAGPAGALILVRASGPVIQRTGGIAGGMSGSPVYFHGRLAGAIGFGWTFADHSLGLVTPIEVMQSALPAPRRSQLPPTMAGPWTLPAPVHAGGRRVARIAVAASAAPVPPAAAAADVAVMVPLARPLLVSGMGTRAAALLQEALGPMGVQPVQGAAGGSTTDRPVLVPGSAVGVQLIRGDLNAVAIGTLTYRDGERILAFGHPVLNRGDSAYLLTSAVIHGVVPSASFPFKIGSAGAPVGVVAQDRRAGVGGIIGRLPPMVGVRLSVLDGDRGRRATLGTQVVQDPQLGPVLALVSALDVIDRALDRVGGGTARVRLTLRGRGLDAPIVRENVFYHSRDIGSAAMLELPEALRLLFANEFVRTGPVDVAVEAEVRQARQTAAVVEAELGRPRLRRGDVASVRVTLRPFQGDPVVRDVELAVPEQFPVGPATVLIRAGGRPVPEGGLPAALLSEPVETAATSAAEQLAAFADRDRNTDVVVELVPGPARFPDITGAAATRTAKVRVATPWVVRGRVQLPTAVEGP